MATICFASNKIDRSELQIGDHIYTFRSLYSYTHHGIYVGDGKVIHFSRTEEDSEKWTKRQSSTRCDKCGHDPKSERGVIKTCVDHCFLKGRRANLFRFKYSASSLRFFVDTPGACSTAACDEPGVAVDRAEEMLRSNGFGEYDLWENNCECFAVYCKTGQPLSVQAVFLQSTADMGFRGIRKGLLKLNPVRLVKDGLKMLVVPKFEALQRDKMVHSRRY